MSRSHNREKEPGAYPDLTIVRADAMLPPPEHRMTAAEIIEDYLDHLCAPLIGIVPYPERFRLREETGFHLEQRVNDYLLQGMSEREATFHAIERVGASEKVGRAFLEAWFKHQPQGRLAKTIGLANSYALVPFAAATLLTTSLLLLRVFLMPTPEPFMFGLSLADIRHVIPEPLPLPEKNWQSVLLYVVAVVAPDVAGWFTGTRAPVSSASAVYLVQTALTLYTFVFSTLVLPFQEGVALTLFMVFFWLPVGCATAHVAGLIAWQRRSRRFAVQAFAGGNS